MAVRSPFWRLFKPVRVADLGIENVAMSGPDIEEILPRELSRAVYDGAVQCFLAYKETWPQCPRRNREVTQWLHYYEATWVCALFASDTGC